MARSIVSESDDDEGKAVNLRFHFSFHNMHIYTNFPQMHRREYVRNEKLVARTTDIVLTVVVVQFSARWLLPI